jgi:hypothetical protein
MYALTSNPLGIVAAVWSPALRVDMIRLEGIGAERG